MTAGEPNPSAPEVSGEAATSASAAKTFGGDDLPPGVRSLASAVTRALPKAAELDPVWFDLPLGDLGEIRVEFVTSDEGELLSSKVLEVPPARNALTRLLERTFLFLKNGRFAVDPAHLAAGSQTIKIRGQLTQRGGNDNELAEPQHTFVLHQEAPTRSKPGLAYVTFNSGRHIAFVIELE
ncbi:MAG: hypothetical protein SFV15_06150 [Polyangiaceae bacterium]|nr:hypothetical protein [Polyangiaceae bacterium]